MKRSKLRVLGRKSYFVMVGIGKLHNIVLEIPGVFNLNFIDPNRLPKPQAPIQRAPDCIIPIINAFLE